MLTNPGGKTIIKNEDIWWVKESAGIIIVDNNKKVYWLLTGFDEYLWQFLVLNNSFDVIVDICKRYFDTSNETAQSTVVNKIGHWIEQGIIEIRGM